MAHITLFDFQFILKIITFTKTYTDNFKYKCDIL